MIRIWNSYIYDDIVYTYIYIPWFIISTVKPSSISRTKSLNLNVSNLVLQLSLLNPLKPGDKSRMKM